MARYLAVLLLMIVGVGEMWGQTDTDYSGTYYIASNTNDYYKNSGGSNTTTNYYLCPTDETSWICYVDHDNYTNPATDNDQPFLTTYRYRNGSADAIQAVWLFEKAPAPNSDYYYIRHKATNRYLTYNGPIATTSGSGTNRIRFHLQSTATENSLFQVTLDVDRAPAINIAAVAAIDVYFYDEKNCIYLNLSSADAQSLQGTDGKKDGPTNYKNVGATVGIWYDTGRSSEWYLEDYITRPTISYNANSLIEITAPGSTAIYYTVDGTTPSASNGREYDGPFDPADDVTTIKAVAIVGGEESNVATFTPIALLGSTHKRLIQSQNNGWTTGDHQGFHYYMIPDDNGSVNTTSLFRPTMQWYFLNAGSEDSYQYYYIVNNNGKALCYNEGITMADFNIASADNSYKFRLTPYPAEGTPTDYNIVPYGLTSGNMYLNKNGGNTSANNLNLHNSSGLANTRWKFVLPSVLDKTAPFNTSEASAQFYKIGSKGSEGYYVITPSGEATAVTTLTSTEDADQQAMSWYFEEIVKEEEVEEDWLTYYYIRNAMTGQYLYFTKDVSDKGAAFEMRGTIESDNVDRYAFTWARTTETDCYYIVPKLLKDETLNNISTMNRNGNTLRTVKARTAGNNAWTFTPANVFCIAPTITQDETEKTVKMTTITPAAEIYYTKDGSNPVIPAAGEAPDAGTYLYEDEFLPTLDATTFKAVVVLKTDHANTSGYTALELEQCATPVPGYHGQTGSVTLTTTTPGAHICYATDGDPVLSESFDADKAEVEFAANTRTVLTAVAAKRGWRKSEPYQMTFVYMPTITLEKTSVVYTGQKIEPAITSVSVAGDDTDIPANDYTVSDYYNNKNHGTATVIVTETEGCTYKLYGTAEFTIEQAELKEVKLAQTSILYNHLHQTPDIDSVKAGDGGTIVVDASDYDVSYSKGGVGISSDNIRDKGDYTVTVTAKSNSNFTGSKTATFTITAKPLTHSDIDVNVTKDGNNLVVSVTDGGNVTLTEGTDYTLADVTDSNGYHQYTITGKDNYEGTREMTFVDVSFVKLTGDNVDYAATFAAKTDMATPTGMSAYIVSGLNAKKTAVELQAVDYLPKDVPVLLLSNKNVDGFSKGDKTGSSTTIFSGNKLKITTEETHFATGKIYLFYKGEFVLNAEGDLAANKIYLDLGTTASPAPRLAIFDSELLGINGIRTDEESETEGRWYRLDGQQMMGRPTAPGLYLHNGQKIVIRR